MAKTLELTNKEADVLTYLLAMLMDSTDSLDEVVNAFEDSNNTFYEDLKTKLSMNGEQLADELHSVSEKMASFYE